MSGDNDGRTAGAPGAYRKRVIGLAMLAGVGVLVLAVVHLLDDRITSHDAETVTALPVPFESVREVVVERVEEPSVERYPGTVQAVQENVVASRILATVAEVLVRPGQHVETGTDLVVLDSRDLQAREKKAGEEVTAAAARVRETKANFDRMKVALERAAVSRKDHDTAEAAYLVAESTFESAQKALEETRVALTYAVIRAPFDATITDRYVDPGDMATPGTALLALYDPSRLRLEAHVRESVAVLLRQGDRIGVSLETIGIEVDGEITEIVPQAEAGSRSFLVKVDLPRDERLYPGMFGRLLFRGPLRERLLIPAAAILAVGQLRYVAMADARRTRRIVLVGTPRADGQAEVLSGLAEGETILAPAT